MRLWSWNKGERQKGTFQAGHQLGIDVILNSSLAIKVVAGEDRCGTGCVVAEFVAGASGIEPVEKNVDTLGSATDLLAAAGIQGIGYRELVDACVLLHVVEANHVRISVGVSDQGV